MVSMESKLGTGVVIELCDCGASRTKTYRDGESVTPVVSEWSAALDLSDPHTLLFHCAEKWMHRALKAEADLATLRAVAELEQAKARGAK